MKIFSYICNQIIFIKVKLKKTIMKKLFFALAMAFSFTVVSCGSKNVETETEFVGGGDENITIDEVVVDELEEISEVEEVEVQ